MNENTTTNERRPNWAALVTAAVLMAVAVLIVAEAVKLGNAARYARVGPATFAYVIGFFLAGLSLWTLIHALRDKFPRWTVPELGPVAWVAGGMIAQMVLLPYAGFSIATGLLFALTARGFGQRPFWLGLAVGVPLAFFVWLVFARLLMLSLPAGPLERLIP
ncbi:putative tricarboxylic transport membrane protein [Devosia lucknowensis]|uniref:Putative tricarboxylic transport membrane protein n=1 Tax=Devosia lucknowensis TaxID=1096929 RepID=A0A1Y6F1A3_9HYPH|nr:tripartite tricarboxylate transporter TctB family protein [Devosia lucknowensis]SMQ68668.1 putative tricarboxylic transport membrane protein [Devosia lucknowensis]